MKKILFIILMLIFLISCSKCPECEKCQKCKLDNKALVDLPMLSANIDSNNPNKFSFIMSLVNYGSEEAKNVSVTCYMQDKNDDYVMIHTKEIGNVASTSTLIKTLTVNNPGLEGYEIENIVHCFIRECEDCVILDKLIPEYAISRNVPLGIVKIKKN